MFPPFRPEVLREERRRQDEQSAPFVARARKRNSLQVLLSRQYDRSEYCDVTLKVGDEEALAHRCVLVGISPYFRNLFTKDGKTGPKSVNLTDKFQSIQPVTSVLEFIYHGEIQIEKSDVNDLFHATRLFKMKDLEELCVHFLLKKLSLETCLWTWGVSLDHTLGEVEDVAKNLAISRFHDTLITSIEALYIQPRHLLHFVKQGLGKFCTKCKLAEFLQRWYEEDKPGRENNVREIKEAAGLPKEETSHTESQTAGANKPTDAAEPYANIDETAGNRLEDVIYYANQENQIHLIYRPEKKLWLRVKIPKHFSTLYGDITLHLFGLGPSAEFVCFETGHRRVRLLNISTKTVFEVPTGLMEAASGQRYALLSSNDEHLYSIREEVFLKKRETSKARKGKKKGACYENMNGSQGDDNKKMWKICIQKFDLERRSWKPLCESEPEQGGPCKRLRTVLRKDGSCYIICINEAWKVIMWHLRPSERQMDRMASPGANIPLRSLVESLKEDEPLSVIGTHEKLFIKFGKNALVYTIHQNAWEVKPYPKDRPIRSTREVGLATNGDQQDNYLFYKQIKSLYMDIGIYSTVREHLTEVPAVPSRHMPNMLKIALVRSCFLDRLEEASCEDDTGECFMSPGGIRKILKSVRSRWREEALEKMSHGDSLDDVEEMTWNSDGEDPEEQEEEKAEIAEVVFSNVLMRHVMLNSLGIPPFLF